MRSIRLVVAILCGASCFSALAQTSEPAKPDPASPRAESKHTPNATSRSLLLRGVDGNGNGIRDDIEAIVAKNSDDQQTESKDLKLDSSEVEAPPEKKLPIAAKTATTRKPQQPRNGCFDYLLRSPEDRYEADLRNRQRTNSALGTHPCDPVVSPLRERPYETEYVELGPVIVRP